MNAAPVVTEHWQATLLVIEDDPDQLLLYRKALKRFRFLSAATGTDAVKIAADEVPDVIILDHILADGERGAEWLPILRKELAHVPVILVTGTLNIQEQLKALQGPFSAHYVIEKPVDIDELRRTVDEALNECGMAETIRSIRSLERAEMIRTSEPERQFAERLARHHEILKRLREHSGPANVSQLSRELRVSRRTIARDLQDLVNRGQLAPVVLPKPDL